ncbi:leucine carboxyl methyltransferase [Cavenderia fasciculata]|uniref:Leucine carboxyl methyltransferase 1 n=1 Tax=Cavenderia fasciculata TaxID=261658 RepID=F4PJH4_CACFS|nr:leucine carboxyl methyltransferase [Cavenderia fasciculata]EGG24460.1 leucine carboxyl methyltransferase [Cavenderia fasciculata]|eukprot:XP_004362311.1 leucine carboxyl methyltransferase [Cavenderia fasciculata]
MATPIQPVIPSFYKPKGTTAAATNNKNVNDNHKESVIGTNDDAASCKESAVKIGYWKDDFIQYFVKSPVRRAPLINRGFFTRVETVEALLNQFIQVYTTPSSSSSSSPSCLQLVNLGCGYDTLFFRLKQQQQQQQHEITFFEVDYLQVIQNKLKIINSTKELRHLVDSDWNDPIPSSSSSSSTNQTQTNGLHNVKIDWENNRMISPHYRVSPIDLCNISSFDEIFNSLGINYNIPTIFLSECVIIYITADNGNKVIKWASDHFKESCFVTYEQIKPFDEFGSMMVKNINSKGCPLQSIYQFPDLIAQKNRYLQLGWNRSDALDMVDIYNYFIDKSKIKIIERLEIFDEFEEWYLIQGHYCFTNLRY